MRPPRRLFPFLIVAALAAGCAHPPRDTLFQTSTIDALLAGAYDGDLPCRDLLAHGDFGIGTFDKLDGEMIVLDGTVYQVRADGRAARADLGTPTPFAAVCRFTPEALPILPGPADYPAVMRQLDLAQPNSNVFCAIRIEGRFQSVRTRSVPPQTPPYPPLKAVTANQPEFAMTNVAGTIVGFRCPPFVTGLNVPGYHLHFLSADKSQGGHVLAFELETGTCQLDVLTRLHLRLPTGGLSGLDLSRDRSGELHAVERRQP